MKTVIIFENYVTKISSGWLVKGGGGSKPRLCHARPAADTMLKTFLFFQVCVSSTRSYEDEEEEESRTPSGIALPPYPRSQKHLTIIPLQNTSLLRKEVRENGEIARELDYSMDRTTRFPGTSAPHLPVGAGQIVEKDEFNKIIPESKKGPQVRQQIIVNIFFKFLLNQNRCPKTQIFTM